MRKCLICGSTRFLEKHHVFGASNRKKSEQYGAVVDLCHSCHNEPPYGIHHNQTRNETLKRNFQSKIMKENNWTTEDFIREFGKNYLH